MQGFTVELFDRTWSAVSPGRLALTPRIYSAHRWGGPARAEIAVAGDAAALWDVLNWLRYYVVIRNPMGNPVWSGIVLEALVGTGAASVGLSLDEMANRVAVAYTDASASGAQSRATTAWVENSASVALYGEKEALLSAEGAGAAAALAATTLAQRGLPVRRFALEDGTGATLVCCGLWETLGWRIYTQPEGLEAHEAAADIEHMIGWGIGASARYAFRRDRIDDLSGRLAALIENNQVRVDGSTSNNGSYLVLDTSDATSYAAVSYSANTIDFDPTNDIKDSANGLGFLRVDAAVLVTGSGQSEDNGIHWVETPGAATAELTPGDIVDTVAGATVTVEQGHGVIFEAAFVLEDTLASVALTGVGIATAQKFRLATATGWTAKRLRVQARKVGSPADSFRIRIFNDSSGSPGSALATATVAAASMPTVLEWITIDLGSGLALSAATDYWILCDRSGGVDYDDFFVVGLESGKTYARGALKVYDNSTWITRTPDAHMPFQIWAIEDVAGLLADQLADGQFFASVDVRATMGVEEATYRDADLTTLDEVERLMEVGTSAGGALVANVNVNRTVVVEAEPAASDLDWLLATDGSLRHALTGRQEPGLLPAGQWVRVEGIPTTISIGAELARFVVEEAEYEVESGRMRLTPKGMG